MSPTTKPKESPAHANTEDSHDDFIKNSRILIESTKSKMERVQSMSNELGYLTSLIKDDRKQATKSRQQIGNQSKKSIVDVKDPSVGRHKDSRPVRQSVPGHIVFDKPKKKDASPKVSSKLKKLSDGGRFKLIESTLQKVKEADARGKELASPETRDYSTTKTQQIVIPRDTNVDEKTEDAKSNSDRVTCCDTKNGSDVLPGCLCDCGGNLIVDESAERAIAARHRAKFKTKPRGPVSKHCCVRHYSSYQGPVILAGEDTAFSHLPALHVHNLQVPSPRPRSNMDIGCKHSIQIVKDSNSLSACLNKEDIRNAEKRKLKNWWHHRCACVQEYIRQNEQMESRRPTLKPNKVTLQTTGFSSIYSDSGNLVPYEEVSIGYRLMVGGKASFPISIRHLRKFRAPLRR
ncbi:uncharacterized protein LOC110460590 [Mizuhopecten yessoensis]|uniref:uncharacterized protein LOC110460590 n=1 Tax=Mizuhopecten yessoensis TaxID=6573 RepID=UPI000B458519|nr:uncharacterized protein LOC110460590 [Mizuhopecten yessoensis]